MTPKSGATVSFRLRPRDAKLTWRALAVYQAILEAIDDDELAVMQDGSEWFDIAKLREYNLHYYEPMAIGAKIVALRDLRAGIDPTVEEFHYDIQDDESNAESSNRTVQRDTKRGWLKSLLGR